MTTRNLRCDVADFRGRRVVWYTMHGARVRIGAPDADTDQRSGRANGGALPVWVVGLGARFPEALVTGIHASAQHHHCHHNRSHDRIMLTPAHMRNLYRSVGAA